MLFRTCIIELETLQPWQSFFQKHYFRRVPVVTVRPDLYRSCVVQDRRLHLFFRCKPQHPLTTVSGRPPNRKLYYDFRFRCQDRNGVCSATGGGGLHDENAGMLLHIIVYTTSQSTCITSGKRVRFLADWHRTCIAYNSHTVTVLLL